MTAPVMTMSGLALPVGPSIKATVVPAPVAAAAPARVADPAAVPLYVDLDGTLIATDLLWESFLGTARHEPLALLQVPGWLLAGKARLKAELARHGGVDVMTLPKREAVGEVIRAAREAGRPVILATAADASLADKLADDMGVFDGVLASDGHTNLSHAAKLAAIRADLAARCGAADAPFDYIGDSAADGPVLAAARQGFAVTTSRSAPAFAPTAEPITVPAPSLRDVAKALRVHQWAKNVFLFVPLMLGLKEVGVIDFLTCLVGFFAFSLVASATYVVNDLLDLRSDRRHSTKRNRAFASGRISPRQGVMLAGATLLLGTALTATLPLAFGATLLAYTAITLAYSFALKRMLLVDVITVAALHTVRIIAGGAAAGMDLSYWLLAFSTFFFLSLALVKRYVELVEQGDGAARARTGRGYRYDDLETLALAGVGSAFSAVLVLALYINAPTTMAEVEVPALMWPICPLILYALLRIWILARRREMYDDPVWFALMDWRSQVTFVLAGLTYLAAYYV